MNRVRNAGILILSLLIGVPGVASAHEISGRFEAPIPLELLFGGAAVTVGVTAILLAFSTEQLPSASKEWQVREIPPNVATGLRIAGRSGFFLTFTLTILIGFFGRQVPAENFATIFVWAVWLKGIAVVSALGGSPWRVLSPWRTIYDGLSRLEGDTIALLDTPPQWVGVWPALAGYLLWIGVLENFTTFPRSPQLTALFLLGYTTVMLIGGILYGPQWFRQGDALAVLYRLFGGVAPCRAERAPDGGYILSVRAPWRDCTTPTTDLGTAAFIVATVYTVSFDGFTSTPEYQTLLFGLRDAVEVFPMVEVLLYLAGFAGFLFALALVMWMTEYAARASQRKWKAVTIAFAPTILPIAVAYEIAHNYPFILENTGQLIAVLWSLGTGGHMPTVNLLAWLSLSAFWWSQVLLIVVGHIVAVVAAHAVAIDRYPTVASARRGHIPLVALMIGYTVLSLWIISRPIVSG